NGGVLGVSLSMVSSADDKNGEMAGNDGVGGGTVGKTKGISVGVTMVSV
ncbi:hypothetical protein Tco_0495272, partial [Tanacetum coccineum]